MITTIVPSFTKVPNINDSVNFETDVNTFLNEINARYVAGNLQVSEINSTANDINAKATAVLNQAVTGGYSQAYINRALISAYTELTATGGETSIITPDNSNVNVYKNGALLTLTTDYTLNGDGLAIDFVTPLVLNDLVQVFDLSKLNNAFYKKSETYSKTEVDAKVTLNDFTNKTTPDDTDNIGLQETDGLFKKLTWANLKATLLTYFDTLYSRTTAIFGIGQTWQDLTASRALGTTYTNIEDKPIMISVVVQITEGDRSLYCTIAGNQVGLDYNPSQANNKASGQIVIPSGATYLVDTTGTDTLIEWSELR